MLDRSFSFRTGVGVVLLFALALSGLMAFLMTEDESEPPPAPPAPIQPGIVAHARLASFVGDDGCRPCHPDVYRAHQATRHAATLSAGLPGQLASLIPGPDQFTDPATGLAYALERRQDRTVFTVETPDGARSQPVDYAFGSGKIGLTLVGLLEDDTIREFRMSYFPARRRWEVTPGQRGPVTDPLGARQSRARAQRCFSCHSTAIATSQVAPEPRFRNVGCEACHGPGRRHIEAVQRGEADRRIDRLGQWDGARINELCGRCHRTERELDPLDTFSPTQTQRFQPLGLARSACFKASAGRLSCLTCHDPHENARREAAHYESVCRRCHNGVASSPAPAATCPVNPTSGCVSCHMPQREVVRGFSMADHWIRVVAAGRDRDRDGSGRRSPK
jgi:hypothetical protein